MTDPITILKAGREVLGALIPFVREAPTRKARKKAAEVCSALRSIYFDDPGMLPVLTNIAAGKVVKAEEFNKAIFNFFQGEWEVQRALGSLEHEKTFEDLRFTIKTIRTMDQVRNGKLGVRRLIKESFPRYKKRFSEKERNLAKDLVRSIEALNESVENLDQALNVAAIDRQ